MFRQACLWLLVIVLLLPAFSCSRLPKQAEEKGAPLAFVQLPGTDSIPADWGKLVSVTTTPTYPGWFQLWFQDDSGKVRMVAFDVQNSHLNSNVVVIPRS